VTPVRATASRAGHRPCPDERPQRHRVLATDLGRGPRWDAAVLPAVPVHGGCLR